ncbi:MAG: heat shock protein transcriptional repressor HspR [Actinomycetota bacterium]
MSKGSDERALYVISVAAQRAGMHPQTLRIYERRGLLQPARTQGGNRRYSDTDIARLRRIAELTAEGVSVEGIRRIMHLEAEVQRLRDEVDQLRLLAAQAIRAVQGQPGDSSRGSLVPLRQSVSVFGQVPSVLRRDRGK